MNDFQPNPCPRCGHLLAADTPGGLCPRCVMAMNLAPETILTQPDDPAPGSQPLSPEEIADRFPGYEILECLGRGGMGVVYKARQKSLDRLVAIKILPPERVGEEKFSDRFAVEAATLAKLNHPNIVTVHDFGETGGLFYIVMEFVDGVNLRDLLREGKLEPQQALAIVPPVCDALQYAHDKGIVHRDIKPENLLLDKDGRIKIADFGIAKLIDPVAAVCARHTSPDESQRRSQTAATVMAGTPHYSAPEQATGTADHRADIYALGVVLYEMLTGERPGKEIVAPSRKVLLDVRIDEMVLRALEKEPERRYQTAGEFRTVVETIADTPNSQFVDTAQRGCRGDGLEVGRSERLLWYGIISSAIGLLAGFFLKLPMVWGMSIAGILIAGFKLRVLATASARPKEPDGLRGMPESTVAPQAEIGIESSQLIKSAECLYATPEFHRTIWGAMKIHQGMGSLHLYQDRLEFQAGLMRTVIPLKSVRRLDLIRYPFFQSPAGLRSIEVEYDDGNGLRRLVLTPSKGVFSFIGATNSRVIEWFGAIREAIATATGNPPPGSSTPTPYQGFSGEGTLLAACVTLGSFAVLLGALTFLALTGSWKNLLPLAIPFIFGVSFVLALAWRQRRQRMIELGARPPGSPVFMLGWAITLHGVPLLGIVLALVYLVPTYRDLFASFDVQLPLAARVVLTLSRFVLNGGWLVFPLLLAVDLLICRLLLRSASRKPFAIWVVTGLLGMIAAAILGGAALSIPIRRLSEELGAVDSGRIPGATVDGKPPGNFPATPVAAESRHEGSEPKKERISPNAYKVTVGGGCEFEILGVLRDPRNSTQWLHPDGTPLASPPVEVIDLSEAIPADPKQVVSPGNEVLVCFRMTPSRPLTSIGIGFQSKTIPLLKPVEVKAKGITPGAPPLVQHFAPADRNLSSTDLTARVVFENSGWRPLAEFDLKQTLERRQGAEVRFEPLQFDEARQTSTIRASSNVQLSYDSFRLAIHLRNGNTSYVSVWHDPTATRNAGGFGFIREVQSPWGPEMAVITPDTIRKIVFEHAPPILGTIKNIHLRAGTGSDPNADRILLEDLALHLIVAIREKDNAKLKSLASDRIKGWPEALPVFAVELREHMRQETGNDRFDLRAGELLVDGDFAAVRCTGPAELDDKCLLLFFVKDADGWRNFSLCNATTATPLAGILADLKKKAAANK